MEELWKELNTLAEEMYGEFGFATLSEDEMKDVLSEAERLGLIIIHKGK